MTVLVLQKSGQELRTLICFPLCIHAHETCGLDLLDGCLEVPVDRQRLRTELMRWLRSFLLAVLPNIQPCVKNRTGHYIRTKQSGASVIPHRVGR